MELSLKDLKEKEHTFMQLEKEYNSIKNELDGAKQCVNEHPEMKDLIDNRNLMNEIEEIIRLINEKQRNLNNSRIKEMEHELVLKEVQFKNISRAKEKYEEDEKRIEGYGETTRNYERKRDEIIQWCNENDIESLPEITLIEISKKLKTKQSEYKTRLEELKRSRGEWQIELNKCRQAEYRVKEAQET
ncbi:hypothetical protein ECANGB1_2114 [Enterospora canceri]|uniref:Uncharacterized protein n=1 Tax=Enterospora canceri TaxID=1081671 RepID=A0A1Y1S556_9MICR|nr:hypothetical protein ECANGB1_2114 [Enterospora canceri]